jgi:hypothetical protein
MWDLFSNANIQFDSHQTKDEDFAQENLIFL